MMIYHVMEQWHQKKRVESLSDVMKIGANIISFYVTNADDIF